MIPAPKYEIGQIVFHATTTTERRQHPCPDCLGKKTWHVRSPAGAVYEAPCPRCAEVYRSNRELDLTYTAHAPAVRRLTIGSVQLDTASECPVRYMCLETGVGSGQVYDETRLFSTEDAALLAALEMAARADTEVPWVRERYNDSLQFCDYQMLQAVKRADQEKLWRLQYEIADMRDAVLAAATLEEACEAVKGDDR